MSEKDDNIDPADLDDLVEYDEPEAVPRWDWSAKMVEETAVEYCIRPKTAFVISGPLKPWTKATIRCACDRQFDTVRDAEAWARSFYPRVYQNLSSGGVWAFLVDPVRK